jgi:cell wall-associated NlpC family hydrolase
MPARLLGIARRPVAATSMAPPMRSMLTVLGLSVSLLAVLSVVGAGQARAAFSPTDTSFLSSGALTSGATVPITSSLPSSTLTFVPTPALPAPPVRVVSPATKVLAAAAALRGRPYSYGASGPSSFDCSGYTRYVFAHALGRSLIHSSASQYAASRKIAKSAVQPGDLVFYTSGGRVYHVGIYAGGGLIWDAPHTGETVRLERIATSSWVAGRVL